MGTRSFGGFDEGFNKSKGTLNSFVRLSRIPQVRITNTRKKRLRFFGRWSGHKIMPENATHVKMTDRWLGNFDSAPRALDSLFVNSWRSHRTMSKNIARIGMNRKLNGKNGDSNNLATIIHGYLRIPKKNIPNGARFAQLNFETTTSATKLIRHRSITPAGAEGVTKGKE